MLPLTNIAWSLLANFSQLLGQQGPLIIAACYLAPNKVGHLALAIGIFAPFQAVSQMYMRQMLVTDQNNQFTLGEYFWARAFLSLGAFLCFLVFGYAVNWFGMEGTLMMAVAAIKTLDSQSDIVAGSIQASERLSALAVTAMLRAVLGLGVFWIWLVAYDNLEGAIAAQAAICLGFLIGVEMLVRLGEHRRTSYSGLRGDLQWRRLGKLVATGSPLALSSLLQGFTTNISRYVLGWFAGPVAVAQFSIACIPVSLFGYANAAVTQAAVRGLSYEFVHGSRAVFNAKANAIAVWQIVVGVIFMTALFAAANVDAFRDRLGFYADSWDISLLMIGGVTFGFLGAKVIYAMNAARLFVFQAWNSLFLLFVQVCASVLFIWLYGLTGSGFAELAKYILGTAFLILVCGKKAFPPQSLTPSIEIMSQIVQKAHPREMPPAGRMNND